MLATVVLVASLLLVLALLGRPGRGPDGAGPSTVGARVGRGARTLQRLTERRQRRLGDPGLAPRSAPAASRPVEAPQVPSLSGPGS